MHKLPRLDIAGQIIQGVDPGTIFCDLEVEVRAAGDSGGTGDPQHIPLVHIVPHTDAAAGHMGVEGGVTAAVGHHHILPIGTAALRNDDCSGLGGMYLGGVPHTADIHTLVVGRSTRDPGVPVAEGGGNPPAGYRPDVAPKATSVSPLAAASSRLKRTISAWMASSSASISSRAS